MYLELIRQPSLRNYFHNFCKDNNIYIMGLLLARLLTAFEPFSQESSESKILMLGLDSAGMNNSKLINNIWFYLKAHPFSSGFLRVNPPAKFLR